MPANYLDVTITIKAESLDGNDVNDDYNNNDDDDIRINSNVAFVQMPQTFAGLGMEEDFFDMRNE